MAREQELGALYARIGLNFDDMENAFIDVERSLNQNLTRLNRANNIVRIRERVELQGLDEASDAERIFEVRTNSLNRQIENQRMRLRLLRASLEDTRRQMGENSDETQRAEIAYENARLSVARLENQLRELNETRIQGSNLGSSILELSSKINPVMMVVKNLIEVFGVLEEKTGALVGKFKELQSDSFKLDLPIEKAEEFSRRVRLAGGELEDIRGFIYGITDALTKGEVDDPEFMALDRYGAEIFDAAGNFKNFIDIWEEIRKAYKKAKAKGAEINFLQMLGGESGISDAMQALEQWEQAVEDSSRIVRANLNYEELRQAERSFDILTEQINEFGDALSSTFQPAITSMAEKFFEILKVGTQWLIDNRAEIHEALNLKSPLTAPLQNLEYEQKQGIKIWDRLREKTAGTAEELADNIDEIKEKQEELAGNLIETEQKLMQYSIQRTNDIQDTIDELRIEIDYENEYQQAIAKAALEKERALDQIVMTREERAALEKKYLTEIEKAEKEHEKKIGDLWQETARLQFESTHSAFESEIRDIENWKNNALKALGEYNKAVGDKNRWLQESAAITANALAKERLAYEREIDRIKGKTQTLAEKVFDLTHSQFDIDVKNLQKEFLEGWNDPTIDKNLLQEWYELSIGKLKKESSAQSYETPKFERMKPNEDFMLQIENRVADILNGISLPKNIYSEEYLQDLTKPSELIQQDFYQQADFLFDSLNQNLQGISFEYFDGALLTSTNALTAFANSLVQINDSFSSKMLELADLSRQFGTIAQDANQNSNITSQITVSPTININLGGAYVFDNVMKARLTDDITAEVANAVKSAVQQATSHADFSYGG